MTAKLYVVALLAQRNDQILVVRKHGTTKWFQPGGKPLTNEAPEDALRRELREELGCELRDVQFLERVVCAPANEANTEMTADVFTAEVVGEVLAQAEIAEVSWAKWSEVNAVDFAPLIVDHMVRHRARL
ncbi:MAG: NUDIX domain-containing protein [Chthonomonas sp.]|nr:NUDIX domain-containing protein [Chthonomonas sp.]